MTAPTLSTMAFTVVRSNIRNRFDESFGVVTCFEDHHIETLSA